MHNSPGLYCLPPPGNVDPLQPNEITWPLIDQKVKSGCYIYLGVLWLREVNLLRPSPHVIFIANHSSTLHPTTASPSSYFVFSVRVDVPSPSLLIVLWLALGAFYLAVSIPEFIVCWIKGHDRCVCVRVLVDQTIARFEFLMAVNLMKPNCPVVRYLVMRLCWCFVFMCVLLCDSADVLLAGVGNTWLLCSIYMYSKVFTVIVCMSKLVCTSDGF